MFSATMPSAVERLAKNYMRKPAIVTIGVAGQAVDTVEQRVEFFVSEEKKKCVDEVLDLTRQGKFHDTPMQPVHWNVGTKQQELVDAVQGTLEGYRSGKGIFVFGET